MPDTRFLPMTREELNARGIDVPDFVYVIGDAYAVSYTHLTLPTRS